jgi:elongation factor Ts
MTGGAFIKMANINLIKELRELTSAGMKNCKDALEEANWDLQKAVDLIKIKGQTIAVNNKVAAEGAVGIITSTLYHDGHTTQAAYMVEVNCNTDFVSKSEEFLCFVNSAKKNFLSYCALNYTPPWQPSECKELEAERINLASITKENIAIRRWVGEEALNFNTRVFSYTHPNNKIGVILTMLASSEVIADSKEFLSLGEDLTMQYLPISCHKMNWIDKK